MNASDIFPVNETSPTRDRDFFIIGGLYIFITLSGIIGNTIVILAVVFSKALRTACNVFIVNLAVADLLTCLVLPLYVLAFWTDYRPYLDKVCFAALSVSYTTIGCSIYTLASISVIRYFLIVSPSKNYYTAVTKPGVFVVWISLVWIIPIFVTLFPPVVFDIGELAFDAKPHACQPHTRHPRTDLYNSLIVYAYYPVPLVILLLAYSGILVQVMRHRRPMSNQITTPSTSSPQRLFSIFFSVDSNPSNLGHRRPSRSRLAMQLKITRNMFIIFLAFIVCLTPHAVCHILHCKRAKFYAKAFVLFNSMVNPLLYGISHPQFRKAFADALRST
ncbi:Rhodopsin, GQ-coupled [Holothuria leucospilota]|uniref:Rhodopsin, GQ-coupled n=1 Tax=Holothuria leucospilota TaxID=206669 RepID=A0A9Q1BU06_HOLLE|nr:Rhodopsin, GQ-coupled [Holothuria leucospilota]